MNPLLQLFATSFRAARYELQQALIVMSLLFYVIAASPSVATPGQAGTLDLTWGGSGKGVSYPFTLRATLSTPSALALQSDGKVVLTGRCAGDRGPRAFCVMRLNSDGTLDRSFGDGGISLNSIGEINDTASSIAVLPDGKLLLTGTCSSTRDQDFCAARYLPDGSIDTSFGTQGTITTNLSVGNDVASGFALLPDGRFVISGKCQIIGAYDLCAARYLPDGRLDESFGNAGKVIISGLGAYSGAHLVRQRDGKLTILGRCPNTGGSDSCLHRLLENGALDPTFGAQGRATVAFGAGYNTPYGLVEQRDGRLLVGGSWLGGGESVTIDSSCLLRLLPDGPLDSTFAVSGKLCLPSSFAGPIVAILLQNDDHIIVTLRNGYWPNVDAIRLTPTGARDFTFGVDGGAQAFPIFTNYYSGGPSGPNRVVASALLQPDGKLLIGGAYGSLGIARFDADAAVPVARQMVEYRYAPLNYYFITSRDNEKSKLDTTTGWARTGLSFPVYGTSPVGGAALSRFYFDRVAQNQSRGSHFYTVLESERLALTAMNPTTSGAPGLPQYEGIDAYVFPPAKYGIGGSCADGQSPVYRLFRGATRFPDDPNHRFTTSKTEYDAFVALGWDGEGVNFCVPGQ